MFIRIIYHNKQSSFIELLEKDNSVSIHQRNLQILAVEMFKVSNALPPVLMNDIFKRRCEQIKEQSKSGYQRNVLVGFVKLILIMLVLSKKRGRCRIFPVQKLL